jgi:hypothetical protein
MRNIFCVMLASYGRGKKTLSFLLIFFSQHELFMVLVMMSMMPLCNDQQRNYKAYEKIKVFWVCEELTKLSSSCLLLGKYFTATKTYRKVFFPTFTTIFILYETKTSQIHIEGKII